MNTIIQDKELDSELQELHLLSTNWMSEVQFLTLEMNFLKKLILQHIAKLSHGEELVHAQEINLNVRTLEENINTAKSSILPYVKHLENLIMDPAQQFDISILEEHAALEKKINEDFRLIKTLKQDLFSLVCREHQVK